MFQRNLLSIEERSRILDKAVAGYVRSGYRVLSRSDTTAQLVKPKRFSFIWALLWFLVFGIGLLVYLLYYWSKKDETLYLTIDEYGHVKTTK